MTIKKEVIHFVEFDLMNVSDVRQWAMEIDKYKEAKFEGHVSLRDSTTVCVRLTKEENKYDI